MYRNHKLFLTTISAILLLTSPHTMAEVSTVDNSGATWSIIKTQKQGLSNVGESKRTPVCCRSNEM